MRVEWDQRLVGLVGLVHGARAPLHEIPKRTEESREGVCVEGGYFEFGLAGLDDSADGGCARCTMQQGEFCDRNMLSIPTEQRRT